MYISIGTHFDGNYGLIIALKRMANFHGALMRFIKFAILYSKTLIVVKMRFNTQFLGVSLFKRLAGKSCWPQNKTYILGASPNISCLCCEIKRHVCGRIWIIAPPERTVCNMEMEVWSWPPSRSTRVNLGKKAEELLSIVSLILGSTEYIWQTVLSKVSILFMDKIKISSIYLYVKIIYEPRF